MIKKLLDAEALNIQPRPAFRLPSIQLRIRTFSREEQIRPFIPNPKDIYFTPRIRKPDRDKKVQSLGAKNVFIPRKALEYQQKQLMETGRQRVNASQSIPNHGSGNDEDDPDNDDDGVSGDDEYPDDSPRHRGHYPREEITDDSPEVLD